MLRRQLKLHLIDAVLYSFVIDQFNFYINAKSICSGAKERKNVPMNTSSPTCMQVYQDDIFHNVLIQVKKYIKLFIRTK